LQESAFIDRIHGLIEGWFMPRISRKTPSRTLGFKGDFFSEVLHELRTDLNFADYVSQSLHLPQCEDMRDTKAVSRLAEGYLKLLFPDLRLTDEEFISFCVNPAVRMRQQIRDELSKIDQEYEWTTIRSQQPDEFQESHPEEKPAAAEEPQVVDPLAPDRSPQPTTLDIKEGQRGISYARLFGPYLKGAALVKVCDPYIRLQYQIYNFMSFCEILEPPADGMRVELMTAVDAYQEAELKRKLEELKSGLQQDQIELEYRFDNSLHDRWIETDTGWRMILGRGLDIFQKSEDRFTLGFFDQTKRKCKATTITYVKGSMV
jgi:ATP-dependent Lon protease